MAFLPAFLVAATVATEAPQPAQVPLEPKAKWVAEYADDMCLLQRSYGTPDQPLALAFRPWPMSDNFTGWVFDRGMPRNAGYTSVGVDFGGGGAPVEKNMASFFSRRLNLRESEFAVKRDELEKSAQSGVISLNAKERLSISFRVPELHDALAVLDDCVADLLATWGFSRDRQKEMSQRPETVRPFASYVSGTDYPMEALREDQTGENSARFQIHADGKTSDCKIVESSRSTALDSALCNVVRRLRYRPALNHAGQPMDSIGFLRIRWQLA